MIDEFGVRPRGYYKVSDITDPENHIVLVQKNNAIHNGNMVYAIARQMVGQDSANTHAFGWFGFGDGGSEISETGSIIYRPTNTTNNRNELADLYNRVYQKRVYDEGLTMEVSPVVHPRSICDINISVILEQGEPLGQLPMDNATEFSDRFVFDEFGIFTNATDIEDSYMLTHVVHHPIQKSLNRVYQVEYTVRFEIV